MSQSLIAIDPFLPYIEAGYPIITPNYQLAKALTISYAEHCQRIKLIPNLPSIQALEHWITENWENLANSRSATSDILISPLQEQMIWEKIIYQSEIGHTLYNRKKTAIQAQTARKNLLWWKIPIYHSNFIVNSESELFYRWLTDFENYCEKNHFVTLADVAKKLIDNLHASSVKSFDCLTYVGFDYIAPLIQELFASYAKRIMAHKIKNSSIQQQRLACHDLQHEISSAAIWAKMLHQENPNAHIGIIIPYLKQEAALIERIMDQTFVKKINSPADNVQNSIEIINKKPLTELPFIQLLLQFLQLLQRRFPTLTLCLLLRSNLINTSNTVELVTWLETKLRLLRNPECNLATVFYLLKKAEECFNPESIACILGPFNALQEVQQKYQLHYQQTKFLPSMWVSLFSEALQGLSQSSIPKLTETDSIQLNLWNEALLDFTTLDYILGDISLTFALNAFKQSLQHHFYTKKNAKAAIHVMNNEDARFLRFDYAWIIGCIDEIWSNNLDFSTFIPKNLQKKYQLPGVDLHQQFTLNQSAFTDLANCAKTLIFSYPLTHQDQPSYAGTFIQSVDEITHQSLGLKDKVQQNHIYMCENILLDTVPATTKKELKALSPGVTLFQDLALCNFRAFATHRLNAKDLSTLQNYLSAMDRGIILHRCLEKIWQHIQNSTQLNQMSEPELNDLLSKTINTVLKNYQKKYVFLLGNCFLELEAERLQIILKNWLMIEKNRPPFHIHALESVVTIEFANIPLRFRIDRLDQLQNQDLLLIDYKSSDASITEWFGERPAEPQLPLYVLAFDKIITAMAFSKINRKASSFIGLSATETGIENIVAIENFNKSYVPENWETLIYHFRKNLEALPNDWHAGRVYLNPKDGNKTCQHCHLQTFCRIFEGRYATP